MVEHDPAGMRLQKVLAAAGVGSRRRCEELIAAGRVKVDGEVVTGQGLRVIPADAVIMVDGKRVYAATNQLTVLFNKPVGVVSTMKDPQGRPALDRYVQGFTERLFHVGRLDIDTSGLLLLTNDGDMANHLAHPSHGVQKTYVAKVEGRCVPGLAKELKRGVQLEDGPIAVDECQVKEASNAFSIVEVVLHEGRNRIVRRMFDAVGHPVVELSRTRFGPLGLDGLGVGRVRVLTPNEVGALLEDAGL